MALECFCYSTANWVSHGIFPISKSEAEGMKVRGVAKAHMGCPKMTSQKMHGRINDGRPGCVKRFLTSASTA